MTGVMNKVSSCDVSTPLTTTTMNILSLENDRVIVAGRIDLRHLPRAERVVERGADLLRMQSASSRLDIGAFPDVFVGAGQCKQLGR